MQSLQIIRLWAAAAWADNELHKTEAAALERLIAASEDLSEVERAEAFSFLQQAPEVDLSSVQTLSSIAREGVYRAARGIIGLDGEIVASETEFLGRLQETLGLDSHTIKALDAE